MNSPDRSADRQAKTKTEKSAQVQTIAFAYTPGAAEVVNGGHTIQVNLPAGAAVSISGTDYKVLQFHFHTPSEEKIDGKTFPLVAHLVHRDAQGRLAVVGVLFKLASFTKLYPQNARPAQPLNGRKVLDVNP